MASNEEIKGLFPKMMDSFRAEKASGVNATIQFELSGDNGGHYHVNIKDGSADWAEGEAANADMTFKASADDFHKLVNGELNPVNAFMMGKIKVDNMDLGMKMVNMFQLT